MIPASTPDEALEMAYEIMGRDAEVVVIPDGGGPRGKGVRRNGYGRVEAWLKVDDTDNVATIFADAITDGTRLRCGIRKGIWRRSPCTAVPYGHKIALQYRRRAHHEIRRVIARCDIKGHYVHVHNLESCAAAR